MDYSKNKYAQRIVKEWNKYGKLCIAIDFDDTLSPWGFTAEEDKPDYENTLRVILLAQELGAYFTIWTACDSDRFAYIREFCEKLGITVSSVNENALDLPYGKGRKIYYNVLIDDRAGLEETVNMLEWAYNEVKTGGNQCQAVNFDV